MRREQTSWLTLLCRSRENQIKCAAQVGVFVLHRNDRVRIEVLVCVVVFTSLKVQLRDERLDTLISCGLDEHVNMRASPRTQTIRFA
jgi:hypothetical protein